MTNAFYGAPLHSGMASPWDAGDERESHLAARRGFVAMKANYARATADIEGPIGALLQRKVRLAVETAQLWRLRAAILCALEPDHALMAQRRLQLHRGLDHLFDAPLTGNHRAQ